MRDATTMVQGSQGLNRNAEPLTTPIFETTTFVFENAEEVKAFNEGRSKKFLYSRYGNPTVLAVEETMASLEGAERAMLFASVYAIRPMHNPVGPLDFRGVYDERSDRHFAVAELVDRGYEDAYRQFIDPVVAAGGDRIAAPQSNPDLAIR